MPTPDETTPLIPQQPASPRSNMSSSTASTYWRVGALYGAAGVCLGAFGAHGLKQRISDPAKLASWGTAAQYQIIHSIALLVARDNPVAAEQLMQLTEDVLREKLEGGWIFSHPR